jgi:large repetitive protein
VVRSDGDKITLVQNQNNAAGTPDTGVGLPGGNAIGQFGYAPGTPGTRGIPVGTIFDDNATRNIFDPTTTGTNGNSATDYIGYFQPEGSASEDTLPRLGEADTLANFVALEREKGDINDDWQLVITNYTSTAPAAGHLIEFSLQFSTGMTASAPKTIADTLVLGSITNNYTRTAPSTPNGIGPGLVLAEDNTLGPDSPYEGRIYAAYVGYYNVKVGGVTNPTTNTDIFLSYLDPGATSWSAPVQVNGSSPN